MNPAKAIEILSNHIAEDTHYHDFDLRDALLFSIAACNLYRTIEEYIQTQAELIAHLKEVAKP